MKYLVLIISALCGLGASAQIEHSILDSGLHWRVFECDGNASSAKFFNYQFTGTDTINGKVYHTMSDKGRTYRYREDTATNQVFIYVSKLDSELVIVDFNLGIGDTLWFPEVKKFADLGGNTVNGATPMDTLIIKMYDGEPRHALRISLLDSYGGLIGLSSNVFWIDGLFTNLGPEYFEYYYDDWEKVSFHYLDKTTLRMSEDTITLVKAYSITDPGICKPYTIDEIESSSKTITPNPSATEISVNTTGEILIFNSLGQITPCSQQKLGNFTRIDIRPLSQGIYFLRSEGEDEVYIGKFVKE